MTDKKLSKTYVDSMIYQRQLEFAAGSRQMLHIFWTLFEIESENLIPEESAKRLELSAARLACQQFGLDPEIEADNLANLIHDRIRSEASV